MKELCNLTVLDFSFKVSWATKSVRDRGITLVRLFLSVRAFNATKANVNILLNSTHLKKVFH